jgi:hypothetical protein
MWKELRASLELIPTDGDALPKPTDADLDAAEAAIGAKLPPSYRGFAKEFGAGNLGDFFRVHVPLPGEKHRKSDLAGFVLETRNARDFFKDAYGIDIDRMIPFADTGGGDLFVWDPGTAGGDTAKEYPVFILERGADAIVPMSPDFETFIRQGALGQDYAKALQLDEPWEVSMSFQQFGTGTPGL